MPSLPPARMASSSRRAGPGDGSPAAQVCPSRAARVALSLTPTRAAATRRCPAPRRATGPARGRCRDGRAPASGPASRTPVELPETLEQRPLRRRSRCPARRPAMPRRWSRAGHGPLDVQAGRWAEQLLSAHLRRARAVEQRAESRSSSLRRTPVPWSMAARRTPRTAFGCGPPRSMSVPSTDGTDTRTRTAARQLARDVPCGRPRADRARACAER